LLGEKGGASVQREVFMVLDDAVVWYGLVGADKGTEVQSARECFEEAWRRSLQDGATSEADAGRVQFRSYRPDVTARRKVALRQARGVSSVSPA
jgi:hypothetical protein